MGKQQRLTYKRDGITFEIIKKSRDKDRATTESKKWRSEYYSRVWTFNKKDGSFDFYAVMRSLKPKKDTIIKKSYKQVKKKFSNDENKRLEEARKDFKIAKKRLPKVYEDYFHRKMNDKIYSVKLEFSNSKNSHYNTRENKVFLGIKNINNVPRSIIQLKIIHELLHTDLLHDSRARGYGYTTYIEKDKLSREIMKRVGFIPPTEYEMMFWYGELHKENVKQAKYAIICDRCGYMKLRSRQTSITKNVDKYRCGKCKGKLRVEKVYN